MKRKGKQKRPLSPQPSLTVRVWSWICGVSRVGLFVFTFGSVIVGYLAVTLLRNDATIVPRTRLETTDPFSTLFTVTNEGTFPIDDVRFHCFIHYVEERHYKWAFQDQQGFIDPRMEPVIEGRQHQDVTCEPAVMGARLSWPPNGPKPDYHAVDFQLSVTYKPRYWPWQLTTCERFIGRINGQGQLVDWSYQAVCYRLPPGVTG